MTRANPAVRPPAKPPPGALWPAKKKYADSTIMVGNSIRVVIAITIDRSRGATSGLARNQ